MAKSAKKVIASTELVKASFNLNPDRIKQLRYIAVVDETTQTQIIDSLLESYIESWEKKNGPIPKK